MKVEDACKELKIARSTLYTRYGKYIVRGEIGANDLEFIKTDMMSKRKKSIPYMRDMVEIVLEEIKSMKDNKMTYQSTLEYLQDQLQPTGCNVELDRKVVLEQTALRVGVNNLPDPLTTKEFIVKKGYLLVNHDGSEPAISYESITFLEFKKSW